MAEKLDHAAFWRLIEHARGRNGGDLERRTELLKEQLLQLEPEEIIEFCRTLNSLRQEAYSEDLWAAAYIINGGASDDGFEYFQCWLIGQGEQVFRSALENPETLAGNAQARQANQEAEWEDLLYVGRDAYIEKTGTEPPVEPVEFDLKGDPWTEDELEVKFPKLWATFS